MQKTKIPWADYTVNPVKGLCPMACEYCYARRMYKRFKWNPEMHYVPPQFIVQDLLSIKKPSRIFWGSTFELFHDSVANLCRRDMFTIMREFPQHTHIILTKQSQNLIKWSPFPENCWVGVSTTNPQMFHEAEIHLSRISASIKFVSIEPLLERFWIASMLYVDWLILGSRTQPTKHPKLEWVNEIIRAADRDEIPVFVKEPMASYYNIQRQEYPN